MKNRYFKILIFLSFAVFLSSTGAVAQNLKKENIITVESIVKDENGNPVIGATIFGNQGAIVAKTDIFGKFKILIPSQTDLLIESAGFESRLIKSDELKSTEGFRLKASRFLYSEKDDINIAFGKTKRGDLVNAASVIEPDEIIRYDNIQDISEFLSGRIPGLYGSSNIRGIGNALFIVDGFPRDISTISLSEIDQITVLKDINSSVLYGSPAVNGVVLITTKRGQPYKKQVNVSGYYGISVPKALPKYLSSADYMELYNEARMNDGLSAPYDQATIENYRSGNPYRYPNVDYYSDDYLKSYKPFFKAITELSGGNNIATYYTNLGWEQTGSLLDFGTGENAKQNKFNVRANVDLKINDWIKSSLDAVAVFNNDKGPVSDYWTEAATMKPNLFSPLIPISLIDPENDVLLVRENDVNGMYLLGGTSSYQTNAFADSYSGGVKENIQRTFSFNNKIDFDLKKLTEGLAFHTNMSFDFYTRYNQSINNKYSVYQPTWDVANDSIVGLTKFGTDERKGAQNISNTYFERRFGFYGMLDYDRIFNGIHHVTGSLIGYGNTFKTQNTFQQDKDVNLGLRLGYNNRNKYLVDFSSAYVNSVKLPKGNKTAFSPSLGLAWVISSEDFMSSLTFIDNLKLRLSHGINYSDYGIGGFYYYDNVYVNSGYYFWLDGTWSGQGIVPSYGGNQQLGFEKREETNFGFDGLFFNKQLSFYTNVFKSVSSDIVTRSKTLYPSYYSSYVPYQNSDKNSFHGVELGLSINKSFGDFSFVIGANALYATSEVVKKDEIYDNQYQYRAGHPVDALFGLVADGLFLDQTDIDNNALQAFGVVKPGDIRYIDQNGDGAIDENDEVQIGRSRAPFSYGLNLKVSYKNFTLFANGYGSVGADSYMNNNYYWVDGDDKYSEYILNRWTETTLTTATFPRLSSLANSNNYRNSTFWLYRNNYFTVNRVQLTYVVSENVSRMLKMKHLGFYLDASNILTVSKHNDIRDLRIGSEPEYRSFSLGVKTMF
ncbi:MAG: SusC/RagA family TonB-linked outer membrane protein [Bacteroidales bacterium]|nr:SusC/RagA family TonB-linked outer membrane protein [Bacteroidales bacterium]